MHDEDRILGNDSDDENDSNEARDIECDSRKREGAEQPEE